MKCNGNMQSACLYVVGKMEPKYLKSGILILLNPLFFPVQGAPYVFERFSEAVLRSLVDVEIR